LVGAVERRFGPLGRSQTKPTHATSGPFTAARALSVDINVTRPPDVKDVTPGVIGEVPRLFAPRVAQRLQRAVTATNRESEGHHVFAENVGVVLIYTGGERLTMVAPKGDLRFPSSTRVDQKRAAASLRHARQC
jgi:hypothetical protein